jgi:hypothetical protein
MGIVFWYPTLLVGDKKEKEEQPVEDLYIHASQGRRRRHPVLHSRSLFLQPPTHNRNVCNFWYDGEEELFIQCLLDGFGLHEAGISWGRGAGSHM